MSIWESLDLFVDAHSSQLCVLMVIFVRHLVLLLENRCQFVQTESEMDTRYCTVQLFILD
jgi:hypothetical protein